MTSAFQNRMSRAAGFRGYTVAGRQYELASRRGDIRARNEASFRATGVYPANFGGFRSMRGT